MTKYVINRNPNSSASSMKSIVMMELVPTLPTQRTELS